MKVKHFIILAAIFGLCLSSAHVVGSDIETAQTPADSIIVSNIVFTPNGDKNDGKNDVFEVKSSKESDVVSLKIFNRTGTLVFSTEAKTCRWDGRSLDGQRIANGTYYFVAEVSEATPKITKRGAVTLR